MCIEWFCCILFVGLLTLILSFTILVLTDKNSLAVQNQLRIILASLKTFLYLFDLAMVRLLDLLVMAYYACLVL